MVAIGSVRYAGACSARAAVVHRSHARCDARLIECQAQIVVGPEEQAGPTLQHRFRGRNDPLETHVEGIEAARHERIQGGAHVIEFRKQRHQPAAPFSASMAWLSSAIVWTSATRSSGIEMLKRSSTSMMKSKTATESSPRPPTIRVWAVTLMSAGTL